jgi:ABC-2 type transport system ATP-binding protein
MRSEHQMTIVLTTHYLDEADSMAERVVVVDHGEIIADDTAEALKTKLAGDRITVTAVDPAEVAELAGLVEKVPGAMEIAVTDSTVEARVEDGPAALPELTIAAYEAGIRIAASQLRRPTLDDVFLNLTGRSLREDESATDKETKK